MHQEVEELLDAKDQQNQRQSAGHIRGQQS
jgi:hypothetical protein